jgi:hypothetical protein
MPLYMFVHNLLNVLVQIADKMELQTNLRLVLANGFILLVSLPKRSVQRDNVPKFANKLKSSYHGQVQPIDSK